MQWSLVLLFSLLLASLPCLECARAKTINYDALERAWESGDEEQELRTEGDEHYRQLADKSEEAKALGPQMIFVTLHNKHSQHGVASRWKEMLWNGGVEVNIYEVADSKLLVGLQKGIFVNDVMRFLNEQRDVKGYEWNGKAYSNHSYRHHKHQQKVAMKPRRKKAKEEGAKSSKPVQDLHANRKHPHQKHTQTETTSSKTTGRRVSNDEL